MLSIAESILIFISSFQHQTLFFNVATFRSFAVNAQLSFSPSDIILFLLYWLNIFFITEVTRNLYLIMPRSIFEGRLICSATSTKNLGTLPPRRLLLLCRSSPYLRHRLRARTRMLEIHQKERQQQQQQHLLMVSEAQLQ